MKPRKVFALSFLTLLLVAGSIFIVSGGQGRTPGKSASDRVSVQGEITTVVKNWGDEPGTLGRGTWCCKSCSGGGAGGPLKCASCKAAPAGGCSPVNPGADEPILVDCPGTTTQQGGTVTCF